jgi:hypothetical protein
VGAASCRDIYVFCDNFHHSSRAKDGGLWPVQKKILKCGMTTTLEDLPSPQTKIRWQVFWLSDHPTTRAFPAFLYPSQWQVADFVPDHSGGSAPELHRFPYSPKNCF